MEAYPQPYLTPCVPLYVLSGVNVSDELVQPDHELQKNGFRVGPESPTVDDDRGRDVIQAFLDIDSNSVSPAPVPEKARIPPVTFRVAKAKYTFPARKASPQASPADSGPDPLSAPPQQNTLHSPLSPLSVGSPLFSDGVMTPLWNAKYQYMVPSVFVAFFHITSDPGNDSLNDNRLKNEIAAVHQSVSDSRYRTRFVVILIATDSLGSSAEVEERLLNIRNGGHLEDRSLFYLPASVHPTDLRSFAADVCSSLRSMSTEFYRDLTKHSRRKRDKGANPVPQPQAGKSHGNGITRSGWVARFEYKLGVFAEYRGEPDVAERHYTASMNVLFDPQGPFEDLSSWTPRFNETRTFADITFTRLIRCQLLTSNPTSAVRSWLRHRDTMRELIDRKGKGTDNYGWEAWESRWPRVMAELVRESRTSFPKSAPYAAVESFIVQELQQLQVPLSPWERLHHAGYWHRLSATYARRRLKMAKAIPDDDRIPPAESPASAVARRNDLYDWYMAMEPHVEWQSSQERDGAHVRDIVVCLERAVSDFKQREQSRQTAEVGLDACRELLKMGRPLDVTTALKTMWIDNCWRREGWVELLQMLDHALYESASITHDLNEQICTVWELCNEVFRPIEGFDYDLHKLMRTTDTANDETKECNISLDDQKALSFLQISVNFGHYEARAGEPFELQLVVKSNAHALAKPVRINSIVVRFEGSLSGFEVIHDEPENASSTVQSQKLVIQSLDFGSQRASLGAPMTAKGNLSVAAGQTRVFNLHLAPFEAGSIAPGSAVATIEEGPVTLRFTQQLSIGKIRQPWWIKNRSGQIRPSHTKHRISAPVAAVKVLPRPPKMDIAMLDLRRVCYTDEHNTTQLRLVNKEAEEANVKIELHAISDNEIAPIISWADSPNNEDVKDGRLQLDLGIMAPGATQTHSFELHSEVGQTDFTIEAHVNYTLPSKPDIQISKNCSEEIVIIQPFEATHRLHLDFHPNAWPSYFDLDDDLEEDADPKAMGIQYRYNSDIQLVSFATETLHIEKARLTIDDLGGRAEATVKVLGDAGNAFEMQANASKSLKYSLDLQKSDMDERKAVTGEPVLEITWRRAGTDESNNVLTRSSLPTLTLGSSEPRVLARRIPCDEEHIVAIDYVLENPSAHFLTFNYSMEPSEDFAFSGPKLASIQLTPLSRTSIRYVFTVFEMDKYIKPKFNVVDAYFNKTLATMPTGDIKGEGDGIVLWCGNTSESDESNKRSSF